MCIYIIDSATPPQVIYSREGGVLSKFSLLATTFLSCHFPCILQHNTAVLGPVCHSYLSFHLGQCGLLCIPLIMLICRDRRVDVCVPVINGVYGGEYGISKGKTKNGRVSWSLGFGLEDTLHASGIL